jgi:hypothetical protein
MCSIQVESMVNPTALTGMQGQRRSITHGFPLWAAAMRQAIATIASATDTPTLSSDCLQRRMKGEGGGGNPSGRGNTYPTHCGPRLSQSVQHFSTVHCVMLSSLQTYDCGRLSLPPNPTPLVTDPHEEAEVVVALAQDTTAKATTSHIIG